MLKHELNADLKDLLVRLREEEQEASNAGNPLHSNGLTQARIMLEQTLEKHGVTRIATIDVSLDGKSNANTCASKNLKP